VTFLKTFFLVKNTTKVALLYVKIVVMRMPTWYQLERLILLATHCHVPLGIAHNNCLLFKLDYSS